MAITNFKGLFDTGNGSFSFTIIRTDGQLVFPVPVVERMSDYYQIPHIVGSKTWSMNLPSGGYNVILVIVTNEGFKFTAGPGKLGPDPANPNSPHKQYYLLTV